MLKHFLFNKKAFSIIGFFVIYCTLYSQQLTHIDSVALQYTSNNYNKEDELLILKELAEDSPDPDKQLAYSKALINAAKTLDSIRFLYIGYLQAGNALRLKSNLTGALESFFKAAKIAKRGKQTGMIDVAIADVYSILGDHINATNYYQNSITVLKAVKDSVNLASALYNLGDEYIKINKLDSAWKYTKESEEIFSKLGSELGAGYCFGNIGIIYSGLGKDKQAEKNLDKAISILEQLHEYAAICEFLVSMSDIYHERENNLTAKNYALKSLDLAKKYGLKEQVSSAYLKLSEIYESENNYDSSLSYYKEYIVYRDSVKNIQSVEQMANLRTDYEVSKKQIEVDLLNQQKRNQRLVVIATIITSFLILLIAVGLYRRNYFIKKTNRIIDEERKRSDKLLLNILPEQTAQELKQSGKVRAQKFESVTVLFTDFKGFTGYAENLTPEEVVESVDFYFSKFDEIIERYSLEKIKTIGDSYMCAGGLPFPVNDHAFKVVQAALEIAAFVKESKALNEKNRIPFDIRIGINTGPVVAGVVGSKKFAYDIWGDAVNIASRMESTSEPGKINVSENTYQLIRDAFVCEYRGEIKVKNRGMMKMYFVNDIVKTNGFR